MHYVYSTSRCYCTSLLGSDVYTTGVYCVACRMYCMLIGFIRGAFSRAKPSTVLYDQYTIFPCLLPSSPPSLIKLWRKKVSFHLPWRPRMDNMYCFELFVCAVCISKIKDKTKHTHTTYTFPFSSVGNTLDVACGPATYCTDMVIINRMKDTQAQTRAFQT